MPQENAASSAARQSRQFRQTLIFSSICTVAAARDCDCLFSKERYVHRHVESPLLSVLENVLGLERQFPLGPFGEAPVELGGLNEFGGFLPDLELQRYAGGNILDFKGAVRLGDRETRVVAGEHLGGHPGVDIARYIKGLGGLAAR